MGAEFKHTLRRLRGQLFGWSLGVFLYALMMSAFFSSIATMGDQFEALLESYPPEFLAFFPRIEEFSSPVGYLDTYYFSYMPLILGIFAIGAGARLLVGDEEEGILDLVLAHPVTRSQLFWGRFAGYLCALGVVIGVGWLGWVLMAAESGLNLSMLELLLPNLPLLALLVLFGALGLMLSLLLPSRRMASGLTAALLVSNFLLIGISGLNRDLEPVYELTPFYFNQGASAIQGLNLSWLLGLLGAGLVFILVAWWRFLGRDIRVGGEGGWRLPQGRMQRLRSSRSARHTAGEPTG